AGGEPGGEPPPADAGGAPPPEGGGAPPEGGAPGGDAPPPEGGGQSEIGYLFGRPTGQTEQEFRVEGLASVEINAQAPVPIDRDPTLWAPNVPGLYVILVNDRLWYVGIAETSIRQRFQQRQKALRDLGIPLTVLAGRKVGWITVKDYKVNGAIRRKAKGAPDTAYRLATGNYP